MFMKELKMYIEYLKNEVQNLTDEITDGKIKKWGLFKKNILEGIEYYETLFTTIPFFKKHMIEIQKELKHYKMEINRITFDKNENALMALTPTISN